MPFIIIIWVYGKEDNQETECSTCKAMFGSLKKPFSLDNNPEQFSYFDFINRGGLMFLNFHFNIILCG